VRHKGLPGNHLGKKMCQDDQYGKKVNAGALSCTQRHAKGKAPAAL
jgi:hypothetical protein